jgi:CPA2 family monovalent cation:H+ antiporter-2
VLMDDLVTKTPLDRLGPPYRMFTSRCAPSTAAHAPRRQRPRQAMHLDLNALRRDAVKSLGIGATSTVASAALAGGAALAFGLSFTEAVVVGVALAMSSTAVVARLMQEQRELNRVHGRLALITLVVQDILVIAALTLLPLLPGAQDAAHEVVPVVSDTVAAGADAASAVAAGADGVAVEAARAESVGFEMPVFLRLVLVVALLILGKLLLPRFLMLAAKSATSDVVLVLAAAVALGAALAGAALGLSAELGAFVAGFLLSSTPVRHQLAGQMMPMRDLFMAVFFTVVGTSVDLAAFLQSWWLVLLLAAALMVGKFLCIGIAAWAWGASTAVSARVGLLLAQSGEFSIILLGIALTAGLIDTKLSTLMLEVIAVTLLLTPAVMGTRAAVGSFVHRWPTAPWVRTRSLCERGEPGPGAGTDGQTLDADGSEAGSADTSGDGDDAGAIPARGHVIIGGFGPVGRACCELLEGAGVSVVVVELNARTVERQRALGRSAMYGDISSVEILHEAGLESASAVILSIPDDDAVIRACGVIRRERSDVMVAVRTSTLSRGNLARVAGASAVTVEEIETASAMSRTVLRELGLTPRTRVSDRASKSAE